MSRPGHTKKTDFIQRNIEMVKMKSKQQKNPGITTKNARVLQLKKQSINAERAPLRSKNLNVQNNCVSSSSCRRIPKTRPSHIQSSTETKRLKNKPVKTPSKLTPSQQMRKKLVRRSIQFRVNALMEENQAKTNIRSTGKSNVNISKTRIKPRRSLSVQQKRIELQNKLNNWLILNGKKPKPIKGFKPAKVMVTPKSSPVVPEKSKKSCWQGLRDEDSCDEILVLLQHLSEEVKKCIQRDAETVEVENILQNLSSDHPAVEKYAQYWIMAMHVKEYANAPSEEMVKLFEKAIEKNAQPISDVQIELKKFLEKQTEDQEVKAKETGKNTSLAEMKREPTMLSPLVKSTCTSPFNFPTTPLIIKNRPVVGESPFVSNNNASVIKLKVIQQSSPVFRRLLAKKAVPLNTSVIVTPVRRSHRIATSLKKPRKSDYMSSIADVVTAIQDDEKSSDKCEIMFQPNTALNDDLCTALQF